MGFFDGGAGARMGSNHRRPVDLFNTRNATQVRLSQGDRSRDTWRCPNTACGVFTRPSLAIEPNSCHLCGTHRTPAR